MIALSGPLGAGKTVFVKGLAEGLDVDPAAVTSPTFVIASEYATPRGARLAHLDLYRVETTEELFAAGFLDLLEPGAVVAVEWAERLPEALPADRLELQIARPQGAVDAGAREIAAHAGGAAARAALARWADALERDSVVEVIPG